MDGREKEGRYTIFAPFAQGFSTRGNAKVPLLLQFSAPFLLSSLCLLQIVEREADARSGFICVKEQEQKHQKFSSFLHLFHSLSHFISSILFLTPSLVFFTSLSSDSVCMTMSVFLSHFSPHMSCPGIH